VLWVSIGLMLGESLTAFGLQLAVTLGTALAPKRHGGEHDAVEVAPASQLVPSPWWAGGFAASLVLCVAVVSPLFGLPAWQTVVAVLLSCLVAILAVRALGQTDLNPVSGVGKLSQIVFAVVAPGHIVANIVAGALAEAGAMQAGDLMQDLKTGHLLRASPRAQFLAQIIGGTFSIGVTVLAYNMYDSAYGIPSEQFSAPVAHVWKDMALLMRSGPSALPPSAVTFAGWFGAGGAAMAALEMLSGPLGGCHLGQK
jgi:OPT family oligopeptide transporter